MKIIAQQPHLASNPFVFPGRSDGPLGGFSARHEAFKASCGVNGWTLHDCRRTARSLMARAGVSSAHDERGLVDAIASVHATYNRHAYTAEKADALQRLATQIARIVAGEHESKVVRGRFPLR
jgi:integrase